MFATFSAGQMVVKCILMKRLCLQSLFCSFKFTSKFPAFNIIPHFPILVFNGVSLVSYGSHLHSLTSY